MVSARPARAWGEEAQREAVEGREGLPVHAPGQHRVGVERLADGHATGEGAVLPVPGHIPRGDERSGSVEHRVRALFEMDVARLTTRAPHAAYVRCPTAKRNRATSPTIKPFFQH